MRFHMSTSNTSERFLLKSPPLPSEIDSLLASQIIVAWAGERGGEDERRLNWWRTDLVSEYGGRDFFKRLLPRTSEWAILQAVRQAALHADVVAKKQVPDADAIVSLYSLGFAIDANDVPVVGRGGLRAGAVASTPGENLL